MLASYLSWAAWILTRCHVSSVPRPTLLLLTAGCPVGTVPNVKPDLTPRQLEVLDLTRLGRSTTEIAAALGVSPRAIKAHSDHLRAKFGVKHRRQLIEVGAAYFGDEQ